MILILEGIAGSGKSTLRDRLLSCASQRGVALAHLGQFSWLSLAATRSLVALRRGEDSLKEEDAVEAIRTDLALHLRLNMSAALDVGHVVVDRFVISSACLLATLYDGDVCTYVRALAPPAIHTGSVTVILTTPPGVCWKRLQNRHTVPRFGESLEMLTQLSRLVSRAGAAWAKHTGAEVRYVAPIPEAELDQFAGRLLDRTEGPAC